MSFNEANLLIDLAKYLGVGGALALMVMGALLVRGTIRIGSGVDREIAVYKLLLTEKDKQMADKDERCGALADQVRERQSLLDRTLEVASALKAVATHGK